MALHIRQPTNNETPDSSQGGGAIPVTSPTNTGHAATTITANVATCRWFDLQSVAGIKTSVRLKANWTRNGVVNVGESSAFTLEYSVNGGGGWIQAFQFLNVSGPASGSVDILIAPPPQDITQIQVRDNLLFIGILGNVTGSISGITIEATTEDSPPIFIG